MKMPQLPDKAKKVLKFEAKLLCAVAVLGLVVYFGTKALIYSLGNSVADAYTSEYTQNLR